MKRALLLTLVVGLACQPSWALQPAPKADDLATGIRQVEEGDLEGAAITLDAAVRRLTSQPGKEKELATAHLYLAMTHLGLSQLERAKADMREAWRNDRQLTLDPKRFPPRLIEIYEQTKQEAVAQATAKPAPPPQAAVAEPTPASPPPAVAARPSPAPTPKPAAPVVASRPAPSKKGGGSKTLWIGLGVAALGGGVAAAAGGGGSSPSGTSSCNDSAGVTMTNARFEFTALTCRERYGSYTNAVLADAVNPRCQSVGIAGSSGVAMLTLTVIEQSLTSVAVGKVFQQGFPNTGAPYNATEPTSLPPGSTTVRFPTSGSCNNLGSAPFTGTVGEGQSGGYFVMSGKVEIPTAAGNFTLNTSNTERISFP